MSLQTGCSAMLPLGWRSFLRRCCFIAAGGGAPTLPPLPPLPLMLPFATGRLAGQFSRPLGLGRPLTSVHLLLSGGAACPCPLPFSLAAVAASAAGDASCSLGPPMPCWQLRWWVSRSPPGSVAKTPSCE